MALNPFIFIVVIFYYINGFIHLFYAIKLKKRFYQYHNLYSSIFIFILWIIAGSLYPIIYTTDNTAIRFFQALSMFLICIFTPGLIFLILYYQHLIVKKDPELKRRRNFENFLIKHRFNENKNQNTKIKVDIYRKSLHLVPAAVIIALWIFSIYIWEGIWHADKIWEISGVNFGKFLIITAGFSGILLFAALDYVRLSYVFENNIFHLLPDKVLNLLGKSLKEKELYEFTKPAAMVLAFVPIFFFPFGIFAAAALISTIGDGAASLTGLKFNKYHFPKKSKKTIPGYIVGFLVSFVVGVICLLFFENYVSINKTIFIALGGAITFFFIDFLSPKVDDDILNPLCCGIVMFLLYIFI
jgi:dolichol kinase